MQFKKTDFNIKKAQVGFEFITRRDKLGRNPSRVSSILIEGQRFEFYHSERMPLSGKKYMFINRSSKSIATFW